MPQPGLGHAWYALGLLSVIALAAAVTDQPVKAQDAAPVTELRFEVASVKSNPTTLSEFVKSKGGDRAAVLQSIGIQTLPRGRLVAWFATLRELVLRAFDIKAYQLEGGPAWMNSARFEIDARANRDATEQELNAMLRALLTERFALRTRTDVRQRPQFELTLARSDGRLGPALRPTSAECMAEIDERRRNPTRPPRPTGDSIDEMRVRMRTPECGVDSMRLTGPFRTFTMSGMPLASLLARIDSELSAPVVDKTGLTGPFDAVLDFESAQPGPVVPGPLPDLDFQPVPIGFALQRQLGLKLQEVTGPMQIVIIESAQPPTPD